MLFLLFDEQNSKSECFARLVLHTDLLQLGYKLCVQSETGLMNVCIIIQDSRMIQIIVLCFKVDFYA